MPDVVEPGTRLVERYRLDERLGGPARGGGQDDPGPGETTTYWRAYDELLQRSVGVCLLRAGDERAEQVLGAARQAAVLTDPRFLRVLDASEVDGVVYVVSEWVSATRLVDLLADGPLPALEARALTVEIAGALAAARVAGLAHLCLAPEHVLRTAHGQVKLAGLGVDAAARGIVVAGPAEAAALDTQAAAAVLYASLTARWPGRITGTTSVLAPAPYDGADLCSPRQVRAGVPDDLDGVVCRALGVAGRHGGGPLLTPDELGTALAATQGTLPPAPGAAPSAVRATSSAGDAYASSYDDEVPPRGRSRAATVAWTLVALVLVAGLVLAGAQLVTTALDGGGDSAGQQQDDTGAAASGPPAGGPVEVASATALDPPPDGNGEENSERAVLAVDGDPATAWTTETYLDPFGPSGLKDGVGLLLDLGESRDVSQVSIRVQSGGTDLEVRVADQLGSALDDYRLLDRPVLNVDSHAVVRPDQPVPARYVLIWLTSLPPTDGGYRGEVEDVKITG